MMIKNLISDYIRVYNWDSFKEQFSSSFVIFWVSFCGVGAIILDANGNLPINHYIVFLALLLPMYFAFFSGQIHPVKLEKMMYLCPMDTHQRKVYIYSSYYFRVILHIVFLVIGMVILIPFSYCDVISATEILLNGLVISVFIPSGKNAREETEIADVQKGIMTAVVMVSNVMQVGIILDDEPDIIPKLVIFGLLLFVQLPLFIKYCKWVKGELKAAMNYEEN